MPDLDMAELWPYMHGWAGSGAQFDETVADVDLNALRVVTMDFRGHGDSERTVPSYGLDRIADDVWAVADAVGAASVILVGYSMSGKLAQYVALRQPTRVSGLALLAGFPASEMAFPQEVVHDWVARAGDRERLGELIRPIVSEPVDSAVFDRLIDHAAKAPAASHLQCDNGVTYSPRPRVPPGSKRWSLTGSPATDSGSTLIATSGPSRGSRDRYTSSMPPAPILATTSYGPRHAPGLSDIGGTDYIDEAWRSLPGRAVGPPRSARANEVSAG